MTRLGDLRPRERRVVYLVSIFALHAVLAILLVPIQQLGEFVQQFGWSENHSLALLIEIPILLTVLGATHGAALAQLWLVAMGSVLSRAHWTIRLLEGFGLLFALVGCWSLIPFLQFGNLEDDLSHYSPISPSAAAVIALGYFLFVAVLGWLARQVWGVRFIVIAADSVPPVTRWQLGIRDLLIATALCAALLYLARFCDVFWLEVVQPLPGKESEILTFAVTNAVLATPLVALTAYRTATQRASAPRSRWRLALFVLLCVLQAIAVVAIGRYFHWLPPHSALELLATITPLMLIMTGTQLIVTAVTMRALLDAGGRLVRAS
jgi:hypothetical protein